MGNATSSTPSDSNHPTDHNIGNDDHTMIEDDPFDGIETLGYRVLGVQPNSPASKAGLVSFLDFLIGCNDQMLLGSGEHLQPGMEYDDIDLPTLLSDNKNVELEFLVFNIKSQEARIVHLTPNDTWGGAGLLGVTIRLDNYAGAEDRFIRVLSVVENGPAAVSGLLNDGTDFILGTTHHTINSLSHFAQLLQNSIDRIIELYVYNSNTDIVRVVTLMPSYEWNTKSGGSGLFGAEVGTGYLHRLPYRSRSTSGKCVERQVRYVTATSETNKNVVLLEDAPLMEMEPPDREGDDDENAEEVYTEPQRERKRSVPVSQELPVEQVSGGGTSENVEPLSAQSAHKPDTNVADSSNDSIRPSLDQPPRLLAPVLPQIQSNTTAAAAIFGQPLVPPPLHHNQLPSITSSQTSTVPPSAVAPLGPPPLSYYGASSSFTPPAVSYAPPSTTHQQPQSYYYGGQPPTSTTATGGSFSYVPPATTAMMPPPPVGGVWNHSTSSNQ